MKSEVERFFRSEVRKTNRVLKLLPIHLLSRMQEDIRTEFRKIQKEKVKEAIRIALSDPIVFRVSLIIRIPPEDLTLRLKVYRVSHPLNDHRYLTRVLETEGVQTNPILRRFLFHLKEDFVECYMVDNQKQHGRPGSIEELRESFLKVSDEEDRTRRIEYDHWPFARLVKKADFKQRRIDCHLHLLKEPTKYDFGNVVDWLSIWAIQEDRLLQRDNEVFISIYDRDGKLLNASGEPFPLPADGPVEMEKLLGRYKPLVTKSVWKSDFDALRDDLKEDLEQELRKAIIESAYKYVPSKGFPPGYFEMALKQPLWDFKGKAFRWFNMESLDGEDEDKEGEDGTSKLEVIRAETKSDFALLDDSIKELLDRSELDEENRIIVLNYGKSDPEIVEIIKQKTGRSISRVAVQKRRTKDIEPLLRKILERKAVIREEERQGQIDFQKGPEPEESDYNTGEDFKM